MSSNGWAMVLEMPGQDMYCPEIQQICQK